MSEKLNATLTTERDASGKYVWVITAVEGDIGTMPRIERSKVGYATEEEALQAGRAGIEEVRRD